MLLFQRLTEQRVGPQIDHAGGQVVAGAPVGVQVVQLFGGQSVGCRVWLPSSSASHRYACLPWVLSFLRASCTKVLGNSVYRYAPATVPCA